MTIARQQAELGDLAGGLDHSARAMRNFQACKDAGGKACQYPPSCYSLSRSECESPYRQCFTNCGGTIQAVEVK